MTPTHRLRLLLVCGVVLSNALIFALTVYSLNQVWEQTQLRVEVQTQNLASAVDQSVSDSIDKIDLTLLELVDQAQAQLQGKGLDETLLGEAMTRLESRIPEVVYFRVVDRQGHIVIGTQVDKQAPINVSDRDYFKALSRGDGPDLFISKPMDARILKIPTIVFARAYKDPQGQFAGVIYAITSLEHFAQLLTKLQVGPHGSVILRDADLGLIARAPSIPDNPAGKIGNRMVSPELKQQVESGVDSATFVNSLGGDGIQRTVTFHRLRRAPMIVIVGLATEDYFLGWREERLKAIVLALGFATLSILFVFLMLRLLNNNRQLELAQKSALARLQNLAASVPGMLFEYTLRPDGTAALPFVSEGIRDIYHLTPAQVTDDASPLQDLLHPDDVPAVKESIRQSARTLSLWLLEYRIRLPDGSQRWLLGSAKPERNNEGGVTWHGLITDITERKQVEAALVESEIQFRLLFDRNLDAVLLTQSNAGIVAANREAQRLFGYSEEEFRAIDRDALVDLQDTRLTAAMEQQNEQGWLRGELTMIRKGGEKFQAEVSTSVFDDKSGHQMFGVLIRDVTEQKRIEQQLRIAATVFESQEGMVVTDPKGGILRVNKAFTAITGYSADEVLGRQTSMLKSGRHDAVFYQDLWSALQQQGYWEGEIWNRRKNGEIYPEWLTITAVKGPDGQVTNFVGTLTDITVRKTAEEEIRNLAFFDPLTQLPNRRLLVDRLQHAVATSLRKGQPGALLFIDLDNFKTLNDTRGHDVGDMLLRQVADRLRKCVREGDTVSRIGGDEFVVVLEDIQGDPMEAARHVEQIAEHVRTELTRPYLLAGQLQHSSPSIGATLFQNHEFSVEELLKRGDLAMYDAKASGRNTVRFFDPEMQASVSSRARLEAELRQGLANSQLRLHYQPQVNEHGDMVGVEALVRWQHPQRGLLPPASFITLAEETRLIVELGRWVLQTACQQLAQWATQPQWRDLTMAINVSAQQFHHRDFVQQVTEQLERSGARPSHLKIELTETVMVQDLQDVIGKMTALKSLGVRLSLDDFGTGYSSLNYLKQLPLDQLKIDQSFVRDVLRDTNSAAIARTIIKLAQNLNLEAIAEGVETQEQRDFLLASECKLFQGYLFSRPVPLQELGSFLARPVEL
jgi:diguanylate cyclase (GGDEF)-like protein/PAS domain S-box-containing protein